MRSSVGQIKINMLLKGEREKEKEEKYKNQAKKTTKKPNS